MRSLPCQAFLDARSWSFCYFGLLSLCPLSVVLSMLSWYISFLVFENARKRARAVSIVRLHSHFDGYHIPLCYWRSVASTFRIRMLILKPVMSCDNSLRPAINALFSFLRVSSPLVSDTHAVSSNLELVLVFKETSPQLPNRVIRMIRLVVIFCTSTEYSSECDGVYLHTVQFSSPLYTFFPHDSN